ncbi:hypothetical protein ACFZ8E_07330 [Methylobacterium sp. HMF5984]|uniref:hypothetical protein n=1 Tax=Methylobacterium sp. HMF5984 TaxID=3367370 RepID=UPI003854D76F
MTQSWPLSRQQVLDASGRPLLVPRAFFYDAGTTKPLTVFSDAALSVPLTQPVVADGTGRFPRVYLPQVLYREEVLGPYGDLIWNDDGLGEAPVVDTTDPVADVDPNALARTGDVKWRLDNSIQPGWVRMNQRTVGGSGSGATELADASARALFIYLWSTFGDGIASVIGGRGTSAADDFAAGKQIAVPTMQGFVAGGLDDMGSSPTNRLQVTTDITLTDGSTAAQVVDPGRLALGMFVTAVGLSSGTRVLAINGTSITLSQVAAAGSTGTVSARFSAFGDAQSPGATGGDIAEVLANPNLPAALPNGHVTVNYPPFQTPTFVDLVGASQGAGGVAVNDLWHSVRTPTVQQPSADFDVSNANPGGGVPISTLQPTRLGTYYLKL